MNNKEIVIIEWNGLKAKINEIKLSESEKQVYAYLNKAEIYRLDENLPNNLDSCEQKANLIKEQLDQFDDINNDLLLDYYCLVAAHIKATLARINQQRKIIFLQEINNWESRFNSLKEQGFHQIRIIASKGNISSQLPNLYDNPEQTKIFTENFVEEID